MLRLVIALAIVVLRPVGAWADPAEDAIKAGGKAASNLVESGLWGSVAILGLVLLLAAIWWLIREVGRRDRAIEARDAKIQELQEKRVEDGNAYVKVLAEQTIKGTEAISAQTHAIAAFTERVQGLAELVRPIGSDMTRVLASLDRVANGGR